MDRRLISFSPDYYTAYCEYIENGERKTIASGTPIYSKEEAKEIANGYFV